MTAQHRRILTKVAVCALLVASTATTKAQVGYQVTKGDKAAIVAVLVAVGVGAGIGIYYAIHHGNSLDGCAVSGPDGLQLQNKGDGQIYALAGEVAAIKPGDRVRVAGKKQKKNGGGAQLFLVEKISKDYGVCKVQSAAP